MASSRNILGFEMEAAALFYLAARAYAGAGDDVRAACILTVSDTLSPRRSRPMRRTCRSTLSRRPPIA